MDSRKAQYQNAWKDHPILKDLAAHLPGDSDPWLQVWEGALAPTLHTYVLWVLRNALEKGIKRLYFLARDAWMMVQAARFYVDTFHLDIDCRYLYCSRYAVRVPSYHRDLERALDYITLGALEVTPAVIYDRAGLSKKTRFLLTTTKVLPYEPEEQIPRADLPRVRRKLSGSNLFMQELILGSRQSEPLFHNYLKQEGLLDTVKMAFVDSGWVGSLQRDLNAALEILGKKTPVEGYYFGLYEIPPGCERGRYHTWFFAPEDPPQRKVLFNNCLFEAIFTAPHGMTLGYEQRDGHYEPILEAFSEDRARLLKNAWETFSIWQLKVLEHVDIFTLEDLFANFLNTDTEEAIEDVLSLFMHHPTREEAKAYGQQEFTDDILENHQNIIATEMTEEELTANHLSRRLIDEAFHRNQPIRQSGWYEGSAALYSDRAEQHIRAYSRYKYLMYLRKRMLWRKQYESKQ